MSKKISTGAMTLAFASAALIGPVSFLTANAQTSYGSVYGNGSSTASSSAMTSGSSVTTGVTGAGAAPTLYNSNGQVVNGYDSSTGMLKPGWYYDSAGQQMYYYSNGTYYDPATGTYGGSVIYPNGTGYNGTAPTMSSSSAGTVSSDMNGTVNGSTTGAYTSGTNGATGAYNGATGAPGVPNTGAGGNALFNWLALLASGLAAAAGTAYIVRSQRSVNG